MSFTCLDVAHSALGEPESIKGDEHFWTCPNHDDKHPSLQVNDKKNKWMCAPCGAQGKAWKLATFLSGYSYDNDQSNLFDWLKQHGLKDESNGQPTIVSEYIYQDADGNDALKILRYDPKGFKQQRWNGTEWDWEGQKPKLLYHLPELLAEPKRLVLLCEGEKDADRLRSLGFLATTNPIGAGKWDSSYTETLKGHPVAILPDNDSPGHTHAAKVALGLFKAGCEVRVVELPGLKEKEDVSDWLGHGHVSLDLKSLIRDTPVLDETALNQMEARWFAKGTQNPWDKAISAPEFLASTDLEVDWLEENLLAPGAITEIFSPRGIGKSLAAHAFGIRLAKRGKRVLLADRDNPPREVKRRLKYWGAQDAPSFKVLTRDEVPPLTNKAAWKTFPFRDYDLVIIDALDSTAEGVGEQDSGKPSKAIASILDIAHQADGPAVLVLGNTIKSAQHGRGSGVVEDRADIVYEVRDATDLQPSGTKDWWLELPPAGAEEWANRASRRQKRDRFKLAFIPSKFRGGEEPEPFILEVDLSDEPWDLRDVTDEIPQQVEEARIKAKQEREERRERAVMELSEAVKVGAEANDPLKTGDAVEFLMDRELRRKEARDLIDERDSVEWLLETLKQQGRPKVLLPLVHTPSDVSKGTAETNQDPGNPVSTWVSEPPVSAAPMNTGRQKHGVSEPLPDATFSESGLFPPGVSESSKGAQGSLKEAEKGTLVPFKNDDDVEFLN